MGFLLPLSRKHPGITDSPGQAPSTELKVNLTPQCITRHIRPGPLSISHKPAKSDIALLALRSSRAAQGHRGDANRTLSTVSLGT